ncbi:PLP-dependent aminotransferase family protein [Cytobacillus sp. Hz8]|uniref:MocR-like pyridoxine biosynthesis transcription factor PdxR n=1 Tax=Cytobacillus sp. Hz8 TaxID=3347168 RepID=UPI0035E0B4AE
MDISPFLNENSPKPLYVQLYEYLKEQIEIKKLKEGGRLPPKRKLAEHLQLSINTVENAYAQLMAEGYLISKPRVGLFVAELEGSLSNQVPFKVSSGEKLKEESAGKIQYDYNQGFVDTEHFPFSIWRRLTDECLRPEYRELLLGGHPQGEKGLREEIASYLYYSRGVRCEANQIVIGAGTQILLSNLCRIMGQNWKVAMEEPGFHRSREMFLSYDLGVSPVHIEEDGLNMIELEKSKSNLVYVTPSHQFPTGSVMSIQKRRKLLKWANEQNSYILEDDYDGEFRYRGKPIPSLQGLDQAGRVIYLGTFSKSLIPSMRLSYLVFPTQLMEKYQQEINFQKQTVSRIHQKTLELFMKQGHWDRHLNKMRTLYRKKQKVLVQAIREYFQDQVRIIGDQSGLHLLLEIQKKDSEEALIEKAARVEVKVYPTSIYYQDLPMLDKPQIMLGFGGLSEAEIKEGIRLLYEAWR